MNDEQPAAPQPEPSPAPPKPKSSPLRLIILLGILLLAVGALLYDRYVARPACDDGFRIVRELAEQQALQAGAPSTTPKVVAESLGKRPTRRDEFPTHVVETYSWRRGFVLLSYYITVVYEVNNGQATLYNVFQNVQPENADLPPAAMTVEPPGPPVEDNGLPGPPGGFTPGPAPGPKPGSPGAPFELPGEKPREKPGDRPARPKRPEVEADEPARPPAEKPAKPDPQPDPKD